jgi:hypothetical protein
MKKFRLIQLCCTLAALAAVLIELGAGHKFAWAADRRGRWSPAGGRDDRPLRAFDPVLATPRRSHV